MFILPNGVLVSDVHSSYCSDENGAIFILNILSLMYIFAHSSMSVVIILNRKTNII